MARLSPSEWLLITLLCLMLWLIVRAFLSFSCCGAVVF